MFQVFGTFDACLLLQLADFLVCQSRGFHYHFFGTTKSLQAAGDGITLFFAPF